jgi:hypothetical protein
MTGQFLSSTCKSLRKLLKVSGMAAIVDNLHYLEIDVYSEISHYMSWECVDKFTGNKIFVNMLAQRLLHGLPNRNGLQLLDQMCVYGCIDYSHITKHTCAESVRIIAGRIGEMSKKIFNHVVGMGIDVFRMVLRGLNEGVRSQLSLPTSSAHSWVCPLDDVAFHEALCEAQITACVMDYDVAVRVCCKNSALWLLDHLRIRGIAPDFADTIRSTIDYEFIPTMIQLSKVLGINKDELIGLVFKLRGLDFIYRFIEQMASLFEHIFSDRELLKLVARFKNCSTFDEVVADLGVNLTPTERLSLLAEGSVSALIDGMMDDDDDVLTPKDYSPRPADIKSYIKLNKSQKVVLYELDDSYGARQDKLCVIIEETPGTFSRTPSPHNFN